MGDASDITGYDRRTLSLSNAQLHMKQDTSSIELHPLSIYNSSKIPPNLPADLSGQSEIRDLDHVALAKHVLRLDVPVEEAVAVHEGHALEDLVHDVAHLRF